VLLEVACNYTISLVIGATCVGDIGIIIGRDNTILGIHNVLVDFLPVSYNILTHSHPLKYHSVLWIVFEPVTVVEEDCSFEFCREDCSEKL
jgi:hypothetical protein